MKISSIRKIIELESILDEDLIYEDEFDLNEGLIKSWPLDKTMSVLRSSKFDVRPIANKFELTLTIKNFDNLSKCIVLSNNLGWFPSYIRALKTNNEVQRGKYSNDLLDKINKIKFDECIITFEAKYDIIVHNVPEYLYHITPRTTAAKILKFGLSPKTNSMLSSHPERIYLAKNINDVERLPRKLVFAAKSGDGYFWILKIQTSLIPSYFRIFNSTNLQNNLYDDPNYIGKGYYTLNSIPPNAIEFEKEINTNDFFKNHT